MYARYRKIDFTAYGTLCTSRYTFESFIIVSRTFNYFVNLNNIYIKMSKLYARGLVG